VSSAGRTIPSPDADPELPDDVVTPPAIEPDVPVAERLEIVGGISAMLVLLHLVA